MHPQRRAPSGGHPLSARLSIASVTRNSSPSRHGRTWPYLALSGTSCRRSLAGVNLVRLKHQLMYRHSARAHRRRIRTDQMHITRHSVCTSTLMTKIVANPLAWSPAISTVVQREVTSTDVSNRATSIVPRRAVISRTHRIQVPISHLRLPPR